MLSMFIRAVHCIESDSSEAFKDIPINNLVSKVQTGMQGRSWAKANELFWPKVFYFLFFFI